MEEGREEGEERGGEIWKRERCEKGGRLFRNGIRYQNKDEGALRWVVIIVEGFVVKMGLK
jgi:hypothetical protein